MTLTSGYTIKLKLTNIFTMSCKCLKSLTSSIVLYEVEIFSLISACDSYTAMSPLCLLTGTQKACSSDWINIYNTHAPIVFNIASWARKWHTKMSSTTYGTGSSIMFVT